MLIPKGTGIKDFIDRYFVEDAMPDEPVIDEQVRVVYYETEERSSAVPTSREKCWPSTSTSKSQPSTMCPAID